MHVCIRRVYDLPRLSPSGPRSIRHSSICPYGENISRMSFSLHFLDIIPINSFLSSTAVVNITQHQTHLLCVKVNDAIQHSTCPYTMFHRVSSATSCQGDWLSIFFIHFLTAELCATHTRPSCSVPCWSTIVPPPLSPTGLISQCSGHSRAWAWLSHVHTSSCHSAVAAQWRTTQRTWLYWLFCGLFCVILVIDGLLKFLDFLIMQGGIICMIILHIHVEQPCYNFACLKQ